MKVSNSDLILLKPVEQTTRKFWIVAGILFSIWLIGLLAYLTQYRHGLSVTGLSRPTYWGIYITNFVFFIGISHAGTLISAILRISRAEWRRAITRSAEVITVMVLLFGVGNILIDMGRPDRMLNVLKYPHFTSPLLWDVTSITCYLTASLIYLYLPLIPDIARLRDHGVKWKRFYRTLALGWQETPKQKRILEILISIMAVAVIPIAISVHTVVSYVFSMTIQPMWHSAIFGPYFVVGAIFSGIAALLIAMAIIRKVYHLEEYLKNIHFNYLGILLLVMSLLWFYFTFGEYLTVFYGNEPIEMEVYRSKLTGPYAFYFWAMFVSCFVIPLIILVNRRTRTVTGTVIASIFVTIGMWLERFTIVVPTLINPRLPYAEGAYCPTWVEFLITMGCFAAFILLYMIFTKIFPIVSIWEIEEGRETSLQEVHERVKGYLPGSESKKYCLLALLLFVVSIPSVTWAQEEFPENPTSGARLFSEKGCFKCHSILGQGGHIGHDLARIDLGGSRLDLASNMLNHAETMASKMHDMKIIWPHLNGEEIDSLVAYLYYINYFDKMGDAAEGEKHFGTHGCNRCHLVAPSASGEAPPLTTFPRNISPIYLAKTLWNHGPNMQSKMAQMGIGWPNLEGSEIMDLVAYIKGVARSESEKAYLAPGNPNEGKTVFTDKGCVLCHGDPTTRTAPNLANRSQGLKQSLAKVVARMWNHAPQIFSRMRKAQIEIPKFTEKEMANLVAYIYFLNYPAPPPDRAAGQRLFVSRQCSVCHSLGEGLQGIGPDLSLASEASSQIDMVAAMWNHAPFMQTMMHEKEIAWPHFEKGDLNDLLGYIQSFKKESETAH